MADNYYEIPIDQVGLQTLEEIEQDWRCCTRCPMSTYNRTEHRYGAVIGSGNPNAKVMLVGQWPGDREEQTGQAMIGKGGEWTRRAIEGQVGLQWEDLYLTNILGCRESPTGGVKAAAANQMACLPRLDALLLTVHPAVVVALGKLASQRLSGDTRASMSQLSGRAVSYRGFPVLCVSHPLEADRQTSDWAYRNTQWKVQRELSWVRSELQKRSLLPEKDYN
jgi:uracil-DNA glycosylase